MNYPLMETPFPLAPFEEMKKKQAEQYFQWFIQDRENRIAILQNHIKETGGNIPLDKSVESLLPLWEWFQGQMEWEEVDREELNKRLSNSPEWMHPYILEDTTEPTLLTKAIAVDIANYFGDTFIAHNPTISCGYLTRPKALDGVNQPILVGFRNKAVVNPRTLISTCASKDKDEMNKERLVVLYNVLIKDIS